MYDDILGKEENKKVTLKWEPVNKVIGYNLYYREISYINYDMGKLIKVDVGNTTTHILSVKPNTIYELYITAYSKHGESKRSEKVIYKPKEK